MRLPSLHLNGTSRDALFDQTAGAQRAVCAAQAALREAWPNGRDYYPQGDGALREAEAEWNAMMAKLDDVAKELGARLEGIDNGGYGVPR